VTALDRVRAMLGTGLALPGFPDLAAHQRRLDARAIWLREHAVWLSPDGAAYLASFSLGAWAQRYPVQGYDVGEDAALFVARWMVERALPVTADHMHAALDEWRLRQLAEQAGVAQAKLDSRGTIDFAEALAEIGGPRNEVTISAVAPERRPMNRQERRAERSRRRRG